MTDPDELDALAAQAAEGAQWAIENSPDRPDIVAELLSAEKWAKNIKEKKGEK